MDIVFMGTPEFAIPSLMGLINSHHRILAVITQPDRPKGRGKKIIQPPVKEVAVANNLRVLQPEKVKEISIISEIASFMPDVIVVIAYGQILSKELLAIPPKGCINVHASLLPKYRGAAPINWAIINGESVSGVTTMYMDEGLDTGDMIYKKEIKIHDQMNAEELHDALSVMGSDLLLKTLASIEENRTPRIPQDHNEFSYAPMLDKKTGEIDWHLSAKKIDHLIRGTNPWPGAYTFLEGHKMKIWDARIIQGYNKDSEPGTIIDYNPRIGWVVKTGEGFLAIETIQMPNNKKMHVDAYTRGHHVNIGTFLGNPSWK